MKLRKGDKIKVISGKDKGAEGVIEHVIRSKSLVLIGGVNMATKHSKPKQGKQGGIGQVNRPIHISNVMLMNPKGGKTTRIGYKIVDQKKYRISKSTGDLIDK